MKEIFLIILGISTFLRADFIKSNGVVTDSKTTLEWQDDYSDNNGSIKQSTWMGAISYCEALKLDGGGWRLANIKELTSLVDDTRLNPAMNSAFENRDAYYYWSSTTYVGDMASAWYIQFHSGTVYSALKTNNNFNVKCVRAGQ